MINGILNIYKEKGYTSHDVVARLRGIFGQKKIGHTGTLDPDAEGVLPVCLGRATKVCDLLTDKDKTYEAVLLLGKETDTQDITGTVLKECDPSEITEETAKKCIESFIGEYDQIPPMYSALKVNGKKQVVKTDGRPIRGLFAAGDAVQTALYGNPPTGASAGAYFAMPLGFAAGDSACAYIDKQSER